MTLRSKLALAVLALITTGLARAQLPVDAYDPNVNGTVNTISQGFTGELLIGGGFSQVGGQSRPRLAVLRADGRPEPQFQPSLGSGTVFDSLRDTFGDFVVVGSFTSGGNRIARIDPETGAAVGSMSAVNPNGTIRAVAEAAEVEPITLERKLYLGGAFSTIGGQPRTRVARVNYNGTLDTSFVPPAYAGTAYALAVQGDGKLLVGGDLRPTNSPVGRRIYRLNSDGSQDPGFTAPAVLETGNYTVRAIALDLGGRIVIAGANGSAGFVMRLNPNGSLDSSFTAPNLNGPVLSLALQPDGRLVIGGDFTNASLRARLARLNHDGSVDSSFVPLMIPNGAVNALAVRPGGEVVFAGAFTNINGTIPRNRIAAVSRYGRLDQGLTVNIEGVGTAWLKSAVPRPGGLLLAGDFTDVNGVFWSSLAAVVEQGTLVTSFNPIINGVVSAVTVQPDGRILIAGNFTQVNSQPRSGVARLHADGSLDNSFVNPDVVGWNGDRPRVRYLRLLQNGRILIGGEFAVVKGQPRLGLARLNANGSLDNSFVPDPAIALAEEEGFGDRFQGVVLHPDGDYLIFRSLYRQAATPELNLVRVRSDGSLHPGFNTDFSTNRAAPEVYNAVVFGDRILVPAQGKTTTGFLGLPANAWPSGPWRDCERAAWLSLSGAFDGCAGWERENGRFWAGASRMAGGPALLGTRLPNPNTPETWTGTLVLGLYSDPDDAQSLRTLGQFTYDTFGNLHDLTSLGLSVLPDGRVLTYSSVFISDNGQPSTSAVSAVRIRHDLFVDPEPVWEAGNNRVTWQYGGGPVRYRTGAPLSYPPRVLVSSSCCDPASFQPPVGGGRMTWIGQRWVLDDFEGLPGVFYIVIDAQAEDGRGNSWPLRSPIHRLESTLPLPPAQADLEMKLVANVDQAVPGQSVTFSVQVSNLGPDSAVEAEAFVNLPDGFQLLGFDVDRGDFDPSQGYWKILDLDSHGAAASAELTLQVQVLGDGGYTLSAAAASSTFDPDQNNNERALELDVLLARSDLALSITLQESQVLPGQVADFDVRVSNNGPDPAGGVVVSLAIPVGYTWVGDNSGGNFDPSNGRWQVGNLGVGADRGMRLSLEVNPAGDYLLFGQAGSNSIDPDPSNNTAIARISAFADLAVSLRVEPPLVVPGDPVKISVDFVNLGPSVGEDVQVQIALPAAFALNSHYSSYGIYDPSTGVWQLGAVQPSTRHLSIIGVPALGTPPIVSAVVSGSTFDTDPGNNEANILIEFDLEPELQISPSSLNFGQQPVGEASSARTLSLNNTGLASLSLTSITLGGSHANNFNLTNGCGSSLAPGASCNLQVVFTPSTTGTRNATIQLVSNGPSSPDSISLTGTGISDQPGEDEIFRDRFQ